MKRIGEGLVSVDLEEQDHYFAEDKGRGITAVAEVGFSGREAHLAVTVENLRTMLRRYKVFLMGRKDGQSVYKQIGELAPDAGGRCSAEMVFDSDDVDGKGTELRHFFIILIAAEGIPMKPVLKGDVPQGTFAEKAAADDRKDYNGYYSEYIKEKIKRLQGQDDGMIIVPFEEEWLTSTWMRSGDCSRLPVASCGAEDLSRAYGHFIYGWNDENFYLGVPGTGDADQQPEGGASGFLLWKAVKGSDRYGYWCAVIRRETGIIIKLLETGVEV